jgi:hypothetical protein
VFLFFASDCFNEDQSLACLCFRPPEPASGSLFVLLSNIVSLRFQSFLCYWSPLLSFSFPFCGSDRLIRTMSCLPFFRSPQPSLFFAFLCFIQPHQASGSLFCASNCLYQDSVLPFCILRLHKPSTRLAFLCLRPFHQASNMIYLLEADLTVLRFCCFCTVPPQLCTRLCCLCFRPTPHLNLYSDSC